MTALKAVGFSDQAKLVQIAREIAINHKDVDDILKDHSITQEEWDELRESQEFARLLEGEIVAWQSATNTHERTKLKAAALIELWLEEANARLYDGKETLSAKTELAKLIARIAEMGASTSAGAELGGKFSVTINLGAAQQIKIERELPPKVIDGEAVSGG